MNNQTHSTPKPSRRLPACMTPNSLLMALFIASFAIFFCVMPRYLDDLWYSFHLKDWIEGKTDADLWNAIKATWHDHFYTDNVRLANIIFVPFLTLPKWVGSGLAAILWGAAMIWGLKLLHIHPSRSPWICPAFFMWAFFMPWYDSMGVEDFQFNYIYPSFLAIAAIHIFCKHHTTHSKSKTILTFLLGLIIGCWHEGFSAPLLAGMWTITLLYPKFRTPRPMSLLIGITIGLAWMLIQPASWMRVDNVLNENEFGLSRILFICFQHPAFLTMTALAIITLLKKTWRKVYKDPIAILLLINAATSVGIHFLTTRTPRTGWWAEYTSILLILLLLRNMFPSALNKYTPRNIIFCTLITIISFAHQAMVDYYSFRIASTYNNAVKKHLDSGNDVVFTEIITEHDAPLICLFMPDFTTMLAPVNLYFVDLYYHRDDDRHFIPVPQELSHISATDGIPVPGNTGIRNINGRLFMPTDSTFVNEFLAEVNFGYTTKQNVRMICYPFISEADGKRYAFVYPWRRVVEMKLGYPSEINQINN